MLSKAYFLAKFRFDTAENEQHFAEILPKTGNYPTGPGGADSIQEATKPGAGPGEQGPVRGRRALHGGGAVPRLDEGFDRRGIEPFELFTSEFGQRCVRIQEILLEFIRF